MKSPAKAFIVTAVASVTFAFGAAPAVADAPVETFDGAAAVVTTDATAQSLETHGEELSEASVLAIAAEAQGSPVANHGFDVEKAIALAESEVGTSRATGWSQPGECIMSAQRWIRAGGGGWNGSGDPVANYAGAQRLPIEEAQPGDIVQYENLASPTSWVTGVHTLMITGINEDGTFQIIESNNPAGSGLVSKDENWSPKPPEGFQAVVWRF